MYHQTKLGPLIVVQIVYHVPERVNGNIETEAFGNLRYVGVAYLKFFLKEIVREHARHLLKLIKTLRNLMTQERLYVLAMLSVYKELSKYT